MDDFNLPEDLDDVEVVYIDDDDDDIEADEMAEGDLADAEELVDLSKFTFIKHVGSVFSSALTKDGNLAVTGGEDDIAYVWATSTGEVVLECTGHKDSVTEVCFNHDEQLVATGDMGGMIQVWDIKEKKLIWCYETDDMEWLAWHPLVNVLISGSHSGDIYIWQVLQGHLKVLPSHGVSCNCGKILPDGKHIVAGYADGQVKLWDIKNANVIWQYSDPKKTEIISLCVNSDSSLLALAPTSTIIKMTDGTSIATLLPSSETEIETLEFINELNFLVTGSISGQLCLWDLSRHVMRHEARINCAVTILKLGRDGKIFVGANNGMIYVCDHKTGTLLDILSGHTNDILSLSVSSNGSSILTASDDGTAKIFTVKS